jgi:DNA-binding NarL/FixJ family response regulator
MQGGTLLVSRDTLYFPTFIKFFRKLGFPNVSATGKDKDGLIMRINEVNPSYFIIDSNFYDCATPYMIGQLLRAFKKLNIAVIATTPFPDTDATWFIFHGVKAYIKLRDSPEEFLHGLHCFLERERYIAPSVQKILDRLDPYPKVLYENTQRQKEVLQMLCRGYSIESIGENLHIGKGTVEKHIKELLRTFNCDGREKLIWIVNRLEIFPKEDLGFYDTSCNEIELPDWVKTQQKINQLAMSS